MVTHFTGRRGLPPRAPTCSPDAATEKLSDFAGLRRRGGRRGHFWGIWDAGFTKSRPCRFWRSRQPGFPKFAPTCPYRLHAQLFFCTFAKPIKALRDQS